MYDAITEVITKMNPFICFAIAIVMTVVVLMHKLKRFHVSRLLALFCWYFLVIFSVSWLLFHVVDMFTQKENLASVVSYAYIISYTPVYLCAVVAAFMYPKKSVSS